MKATGIFWLFTQVQTGESDLWALTVAVAVVADSYGAAQEAGGPAEVAGAAVGDVVVATDGLLSEYGHWAGGGAAHDAVGAVGLVGHAGVGARTHHVGAGLCAEQWRQTD